MTERRRRVRSDNIKCPRTAHTAGGVALIAVTISATGTLSDTQAASQPRNTALSASQSQEVDMSTTTLTYANAKDLTLAAVDYASDSAEQAIEHMRRFTAD